MTSKIDIQFALAYLDELNSNANQKGDHETQNVIATIKKFIAPEHLEDAVRPLMKYMAETQDPQTHVFVNSISAEMFESFKLIRTYEFIN